jgi:hypothetical protein
VSLITASISCWHYHGAYVSLPAVCLSHILPLAFFLALLALISSAPSSFAQTAAAPETVFRNIDPSVTYVGSKACASAGCHQKISRDYLATPMGNSMAPANIPSELARAPQPVTVFNEKNNYHHLVYQNGGDLYQSVYELDKKGRKTYTATHKMDYVVGSALTGYSYLFRLGRWMFQAPLSNYSHSAQWELYPGYNLDDIGFTRSIGTGCLICHNGQPEPEGKHDGKYKKPPFRFGELAISCEACHGPGELHVREMQANPGQQLALQQVDSSIVNPAKLSPRLADDLCRYCHQSGDSVVLLPGKGYLDYRPGAPLSQTWALLKHPLKESQREEANRLETSAPVRGSLETPLWWKNSSVELSKCYQATHGQLTCIRCHSIHAAPTPEGKSAYYRARCLACHKESDCKLSLASSERIQAADDCIACHMEKRPVAGISHSNDTKHRIVRFAGQPLPDVAFEQPQTDLPGLLWLNRPTPGAGDPLPPVTELEAYWTVARKDPALAPYALQKLDKLAKSSPNDPVVLTCLGTVTLSGKKDNAKAADYFSRALNLGSEDPTTYLNLATALENLGRHQEAESVLESGVAAYPYWGPLVARLAQQYLNDGQTWRASVVVHQYRKLFPEDPIVRDALQPSANAAQLQATPARVPPTAPPR